MTANLFRAAGSRRFTDGWFSWAPFLLLAILLGVQPVEAQRRLSPRPIPYSELEREEGERRLQEIRRMGIEGVYTFLFELRNMPRRGEETRFEGQMWGSRNQTGPVFRYEIRGNDGGKERTVRFLVQNGFDPAIWIYDTAEENPQVRRMATEELFTPIKGTNFTAFDLQMPYLFWRDFAYEGLSRVRGRSSHGFLMYPPEDVAEAFPWLVGVRMFLDAEFNALTAAEILGEEDEILRSFNIIELKRVEDQWIIKSIDYRNRQTDDKTRLLIRGVKFDLPEEAFPFSPEELDEPFPSTPREPFNLF